jgi:hypothetical protein
MTQCIPHLYLNCEANPTNLIMIWLDYSDQYVSNNELIMLNEFNPFVVSLQLIPLWLILLIELKNSTKTYTSGKQGLVRLDFFRNNRKDSSHKKDIVRLSLN